MKIKGNIAHGYRKLLSTIDELPGQQKNRWIEVFRHGTLAVKLYAPRGSDPQEPHDQDEIYVIVAGTGLFRHGESETTFAPGDVLFVPAGDEHRFTRFTDDFATWVFLYGPKGGETLAGPDTIEEEAR
jgi:mannose-6-phosphate isomerase-like protein (cupin superfamily)